MYFSTMAKRTDKSRHSDLSLAAVALTVVCLGCWGGGTKQGTRSDGPVTSYTPDSSKDNNTRTNRNTNVNSETNKAKGFNGNLPEGFTSPTDDAGRLLLKEYGAVFVTRGGAVPPKKVVFRDQAEVTAFQGSLKTSSETIGTFRLELQAPAMEGLRKAIADAKASGLSITPRDKDSAKRTYDETIELWKSRVDPALKHWVGKGRLTQAQADKIRNLSPYEQVPEVLKLEADGIYFAKDLSKSIIYSVAPPGTSQHLSMLAIDVNEHDDQEVRAVLAANGWFQTVVSDLPHFTYLGVAESELPGLGLKKMNSGGRDFWVPDI